MTIVNRTEAKLFQALLPGVLIYSMKCLVQSTYNFDLYIVADSIHIVPFIIFKTCLTFQKHMATGGVKYQLTE